MLAPGHPGIPGIDPQGHTQETIPLTKPTPHHKKAKAWHWFPFTWPAIKKPLFLGGGGRLEGVGWLAIAMWHPAGEKTNVPCWPDDLASQNLNGFWFPLCFKSHQQGILHTRQISGIRHRQALQRRTSGLLFGWGRTKKWTNAKVKKMNRKHAIKLDWKNAKVNNNE